MSVTTSYSIPNMPCVLVLVGASGSGKSTWAATYAADFSILSSDAMRALLTDNADHQGCSKEAFNTIEHLAKLRLQFGRPVIIDATNTRSKTRKRWLELAKAHNVPAFVLRFDVARDVCLARQDHRERKVPPSVIDRQLDSLEHINGALMAETWQRVTVFNASEETYTDLRTWTPPSSHQIDAHGRRYMAEQLDIIGDVHGCYDELLTLMINMGWNQDQEGSLWSHPDNRMLVFVGDLVDRGPQSVPVVSFVAKMVEAERAVLVMGNHDDKFKRYLLGNGVNLDSSIQTTIDECNAMEHEAFEVFKQEALQLFINAPLWAVFAPAKPDRFGLGAHVVVSHAAWTPSLVGQKRDRVRFFCLYGPNTGEKDASGYPERLDWRPRYPEDAPLCVTGHTPFHGEPRVLHNTICVDTGCVFGYRLTALRFPEHDLVTVDAKHTYSDHKTLLEYPDLVSYDVYDERKRARTKQER